jgi:hypothetical protein
MLPRVVPLVAATSIVLASITGHAGGWAVVSVEDLPGHFTVGQPTELKFAVRQHGMRLVPNLQPGVSAVANGRKLDADVRPREAGFYAVSLTLPTPGKWTITIQSGFGASAVQLRPIDAVAAGTTPSATPLAQRGQDLFVAKGCNSCHYHGDTKTQPISPVGEDLTNKRYSDGLLSVMLTNPAMIPKRDIWEMPDLKLRPPEVAALVAFINKSRTQD